MLTRFDEIHKQLAQDASKKAAQAIVKLLEGNKVEKTGLKGETS